MIIGIGHDLVHVDRIRSIYGRFGARFKNRAFTEGELVYALSQKDPAYVLAKRFAAKEACAKALGTGIGRRAFLNEIEVVRLDSGAPALSLTGRAAETLKLITPAGCVAVLHLSLTDQVALASAFVVVEARPL